MSLPLRSSGFELKCPSAAGTRNMNVKFFVSKSSVRVTCFTKKDDVQVSNHDGRNVLLSGNPIPGRLVDSSKKNKQLRGPAQKLNFVRTLLIDNYDSYTYNVYQELSVINGVPPLVIRNDEWTWEELCHHLYEESAFDNIVISPGPGSPTCAGDIGICLQVLNECWDVPVLGVCLGHQALGHVHGAQVMHASEPIHGRLSEIEHKGCKIFCGIPSGRNSGFKVVRYHSLVIDSETLPEELIPIAWTISGAHSYIHNNCNFTSNSLLGKTTNGNPHNSTLSDDPSRRVLMGIMHATRPHYGLQFHPESIATHHGRLIFKNFRAITEDYWMRWRSSYKSERFSPVDAMQLFASGQLFEEVHQRTESENNTVHYWYKKTPITGQTKKRDETNHFPLPNVVLDPYVSKHCKNLKLLWRKYDQLAVQVGGAKNIFCELFGHNEAENTFWLDSSSIEKERARFSFMGGKGGSLWKQLTFKLSERSDLNSQGGDLSIEDSEGCAKHTFLEEGFLEYLNKELQSFRYDEKDYIGLPFDFHGGYVGYIGYDLKVECGAKSNQHTSKAPDACFFFADNLVVIDHQSDDVYLMTIQEGNDSATTWLDETEEKLHKLKGCTTGEVLNHVSHSPGFLNSNAGFTAEKSREQYINDVKKCLGYIKDGESYELCLTTQLRKDIKENNHLGLYLHLREKNPAPYAAWFNFPRENLCICCSSPERFLQLDGDGTLEAKPVKGTIARGATQEEDGQLKSKLQYSEKDQSENLMIVDLLRNDLGRVCEPGTVHVPRLMDVESYATVHTMVSTIRGKKRSDASAIDCIKAAFPGGSMTGAPKLRSMELLDSIENCSRGIYSGSIGFFSYNQTFDLNIVIRTVIIHNGEASIGAGGAIVALSNPEDEYEEMILKTKAPAKAVMEFQE